MNEVPPMTLHQAATLIYEEAIAQGVPLSFDACQAIAQRLLTPRYLTHLVPGDIARHHRARYDRPRRKQEETDA
jgi:hypothetical protein